MANYYFDAAAGTTGSGTSNSPWNATQVATLLATPASGDTVFLSGLLTDAYPTTSKQMSFAQNNFSARQWPGMNRFFIAGMNGVTTAWTNTGTNTNKVNIGTGLTLDSVVYKYFDPTKQTTEGARKVFMTRVASIALVGTTPNSWFYDTVTIPGDLHVNIAGLGAGVLGTYSGKVDSTDPTNVTLCDIYYAKTATLPILFSLSGTNSYAYDLQGGMCCPLTDNTGYIFLSSNQNSGFVRCRGWNAGYHIFGAYGSGASSNVNITFVDCDGYNCGLSTAGSSGGTIFVHYNLTTATNITGALYTGCRAYGSYHLGLDGYELPTGTGEQTIGSKAISCFFAHTANQCKIKDLEFRNCTAWCGTMGGNASVGWNYSNGSLVSDGSDTDAYAYALRVFDSTQTLVQTWNAQITSPPGVFFSGSAAFIRCKLDFAWKFTTSPGVTSANNPRGVFGCNTAAAGGVSVRVLCESCDFQFYHDDPLAAVTHTSFFVASPDFSSGATYVDNLIILRNCTVRDLSTTIGTTGALNQTGYMFFIDAAGRYDVQNCLFVNPAGGTKNQIINNNSAGLASTAAMKPTLKFRGNVYVGYTKFCNSAFCDSFAEFTAASADTVAAVGATSDGVDPKSKQIATFSAADFVNIQTSGALSTESAVKAFLRNSKASDLVKSIDGAQFHRGVGAYAYGGPSDSLPSPSSRFVQLPQ